MVRQRKLVRMDVRNFYMEGTHAAKLRSLDDITTAGAVREAMKSLCAYVLYHQYVREGRTGKVFQVIRGSGMGLIHSGELSDWLF